MLFRAIAPVDTIKQVLRDVGPGQPPYTQHQILLRFLDPERRDILTLQTSKGQWEKTLVETQATPAKLSHKPEIRESYREKDVIWLSDHDGKGILFSGSEFDLFIHEV